MASRLVDADLDLGNVAKVINVSDPTTAQGVVTRAYLEANAVMSTTIRTTVTISQAAYNALGAPDANTLYLITS